MAKATALKGGSYTAFGYRAAEVMRESGGRQPQGGSADLHIIPDRLQLIRQAHAFDRDNGLYKGLVNRSIDNILGNGFSLQAKCKNRETQQALEKKWKEFGKDPEVRGLFCWRAVEAAVLRALINAGDTGTIKTGSGKIQVVESECISNASRTNDKNGNTIVQGVEIDKLGRPVAFSVDTYTPQGNLRNNPRRIDAADFIYVANLERVSQTRGVPAMTSNFPMFHRVNDVCDSEAVAWQLLSKLALKVLKKGADNISTQISETDPNKTTATAKDQDIRIQEFEDGTIFYGDPGDDIGGIERNIPGPNFTASITMFLRLLGLPLGLPLELILLDWSKTNYSSARAALEQAFRMFTRWQDKIREFNSAVYVWQLAQWIEAGEVPNDADIYEHEWIAPSFPWIDQLKECEAWALRIETGLSLHSEALKSVNRDRADWLPARKNEIEDAIKLANELNAKYPDARVDWRCFAGLKAEPASAKPDDPGADAGGAGAPEGEMPPGLPEA